MGTDRDIATAYGAMAALGAASRVLPVRPTPWKSAEANVREFHQLGPRSWVCRIERNGRWHRGRGKTKNAALLSALLLR